MYQLKFYFIYNKKHKIFIYIKAILAQFSHKLIENNFLIYSI